MENFDHRIITREHIILTEVNLDRVYLHEQEKLQACPEVLVLSVLPVGQDEESQPCRVVPTTVVTFLSRRYKIVFSLDASLSTYSVNHTDGGLVSEDIFATLRRCFCGLLRPFQVCLFASH